ncbi:MAG TPA: hypothetical protein VJ984_15935 [Xanthomonadales bacterium]|nr:hypothetical protein [Xanthomonadales bacterium]
MVDNTFSRLGIRRLLAEGLVVVASILIAFSLDAWWDDRQLAEEMAEDLAIVEYELTENLRLVELALEITGRVVSASDEIVATLNANPDNPEVAIAGNILYWGLFASPTLDPSFGGIDTWIAAGRLAGIESIELRQRLASIRGKVSDVTEEQYVTRDMLTRDIYPLIRDQIGDIEAVRELVASGYHARYGSSIQEIPDVGTISVPNSDALRFTLQARALWYEANSQEMLDFRQELEAIQSLVQEEKNN